MKYKLALAVLAVALLMTGLVTNVASAQTTGTAVIYDSIPDPQPYNVGSIGFQARSTDEFGDHIQFAGTERTLTSVTVLMSAWALHSTYPSMDANGWQHPITLNLYQADTTGNVPAAGTLITTVTQTFDIPWRPEADTTCSTTTAWRAADGNCYNGYAFTIVFNLNVTVPNEIVYGIAYNTQTHGATPIGATGPYNSLNVGVAEVAPSIGTDVNPDGLFQDSSHGGFYADGGTGGTDTFRFDTDWTPYTPAVEFSTTYDVPAGVLLDDLQADTDSLVTNAAAEKALLATLTKAEKYINSNNKFMAYLTMLQYLIQVERYEDSRRISGPVAQDLVSQALELTRAIMAQPTSQR